MAKKAEKPKAKPNCIYCKYSIELGDHMSGCPFYKYPRSTGIRGVIQCDVGRFELDEKKYNETKK